MEYRMDMENEADPGGESCPEGITFYDLRPYFAATHYGQKPLPQNMAIHMEGCPACRERWQFLIDTDPKASQRYWDDVEALAARVITAEAAGSRDTVPIALEAINRLADAPEDPEFATAAAAWRAVKAIADDAERWTQARALATVAATLLEQRPQAQKTLGPFITAVHSSGPPIEIRSVEQMLFLANLASTTAIRQYRVVDFNEAGEGVCDPRELAQVEQLYELQMKSSPLFTR